MQDALISYQKKLGFKLEWVDIEGEEDLEVRFGENVPVLMEADQFICHHSLDEEALQRHFSS
jgi:thioredoxin reductase (NADPH)